MYELYTIIVTLSFLPFLWLEYYLRVLPNNSKLLQKKNGTPLLRNEDVISYT